MSYAKPAKSVNVNELRIDVVETTPPLDIHEQARRIGTWLDVRWDWYCRAAATSRDATMLVAGYLVREWAIQKARKPCLTHIKVTNVAMVEFGISPDAKLRILRRLAKAGLIELHCQRRQAPLVRPLNVATARKRVGLPT